VVRTRTDAAKLVDGGLVRVNGGRVTANSHPVRPADVVTIALDRRVRVLKVKGFAERRGGSEDALALYEDLSLPPEPALPPGPGQRDSGSGRPTKRERRAIDRLIGGLSHDSEQ
jgi:ribosome-associated heat shock protein Hsp15